jgi:hypothetical protein
MHQNTRLLSFSETNIKQITLDFNDINSTYNFNADLARHNWLEETILTLNTKMKSGISINPVTYVASEYKLTYVAGIP